MSTFYGNLGRALVVVEDRGRIYLVALNPVTKVEVDQEVEEVYDPETDRMRHRSLGGSLSVQGAVAARVREWASWEDFYADMGVAEPAALTAGPALLPPEKP